MKARPPSSPRSKPFKRGERVGVVLGAGATKACDGPLTVEILSRAFQATKGAQLDLLDRFLQDLGGLPDYGCDIRNPEYHDTPTCGHLFRIHGSMHWRYCPDCRTRFRTVMITPTSLKDYRNPHIASLWYQAKRALRQCDRVVFVGYSLPWDDVDVIYLLKRGMSHLGGKKITVVEWAPKPVPIDEHEAGRRYQAVFGRGLDWQPFGFVEWVTTLR